MKKNLTESSLKLSFQRNYSMMRFFENVMYTSRYKFSLANILIDIVYFVVCAEFPMGSKYHFSQWQIYFAQFISQEKYLNFKETKHLIHYAKFEMGPGLILYKFLLFPIVKLKLGHSFYQFNLRFKIGIFQCWP